MDKGRWKRKTPEQMSATGRQYANRQNEIRSYPLVLLVKGYLLKYRPARLKQ